MIDPYKLVQYLLHELHGTAFDDMMRALPPVGNGGQTVNPMEYGAMIQQSMGKTNGVDISKRLQSNAKLQLPMQGVQQ